MNVLDTLYLKFQVSLTAMDSRLPLPRGHAFAGMTASVKVTYLAEMTSFPRKRDSRGLVPAMQGWDRPRKWLAPWIE